MRLTRIHPAGDEGFTLIELLIAIVIMTVISVPLATAIMMFTRNTDTTSERLTLSHDAQIAGVYFAEDVGAMGVRDYTGTTTTVAFKQSIQLNAAYNAGGQVCGTATTPTAAIRFLSDDWSNASGTWTASTDVVAYYVETTGTLRALHRLQCTSTATTDTIVAHDVDCTAAGSCDTPTPTTMTITCSSTCTDTTPPLVVTVVLTVAQPHAGSYQITLTGQRRQT